MYCESGGGFLWGQKTANHLQVIDRWRDHRVNFSMTTTILSLLWSQINHIEIMKDAA